MQIVHDHSYISQGDRDFVSHGYACESFYSLRFSYAPTEAQKSESRAYADEVGLDSDAWDAHIVSSARQRSGHMERVTAILAQDFKVYQYGSEEAVPYKSDWDMFFWCNDFSATMRGLLSGRDYRYFTLSFNDKHTPERRQDIYSRVMHVLELFADDVNLDVAAQYTAVMDEARIKRDAELVAPRIAGRSCTYGNMEGRVEQGSERRRVIGYGADGNKVVRHWHDVQNVAGSLYKGHTTQDEYGHAECGLFIFFPGVVDALELETIRYPARLAVERAVEVIRQGATTAPAT